MGTERSIAQRADGTMAPVYGTLRKHLFLFLPFLFLPYYTIKYHGHGPTSLRGGRAIPGWPLRNGAEMGGTKEWLGALAR